MSETALLAGITSIRDFFTVDGYPRKVVTLPESALLAELSSETVHSALVAEVTLQLFEGIATKECLTAFAAVLGVVINRFIEQLLGVAFHSF